MTVGGDPAIAPANVAKSLGSPVTTSNPNDWALRELDDKYKPGQNPIRDVPSLERTHNARLEAEGLPLLSAGDDIDGQMFLEVPVQAGPFRNSTEICGEAFRLDIRIVDANGLDLCI